MRKIAVLVFSVFLLSLVSANVAFTQSLSPMWAVIFQITDIDGNWTDFSGVRGETTTFYLASANANEARIYVLSMQRFQSGTRWQFDQLSNRWFTQHMRIISVRLAQ